MERCIPLWGGVSAGGFSIVCVHQTKKLTAKEWLRVVNRGQLTKAIKDLKPVKPVGPWWVLCDNESFLRSKELGDVYRRNKICLWKIPKHSPDCNPVEKYWAWLRKKLRAMDLADAVAKRPVLGKMAYTQRVRGVLKQKKAQNVAKACALGLKKVCREILKKRGAATRG